ncbi:MAG: gamma-glutamyl-gamma-aminobutyrate hydrolase family protein [Actinobacteria bacterium]|uniref:Unannotated protein n=1 Tax=freshwater metagenome TaxID=449393 RepID=A0A6J7L627_9ZZZZ|nr:gamma-glutamyl-gamma-aminobutyrate hydrolase family protein [Actinomycetota bacterium]
MSGLAPLIGYTVRELNASALTSMDDRYHPATIEVAISGFAESLARLGAVPVSIPYAADQYALLDHLDALVVTGGQDVSASFKSGRRDPENIVRDDSAHPSVDRDVYEWRLVVEALRRGMPILGVCRGHQLINAGLGGVLIEDLPHGPIPHLPNVQPPTDGHADHVVDFSAGSLAAKIYGERRVVNSWHHQAVATPGRGMVVSGRAPDGIVEAVEHENGLVLTVQWHPEWQATPDEAFVWLSDVAKKFRSAK